MTEAATRQRVHFIDSESVPGSQYRVALGAGAKPSCDCPQGKLGRNCKHIEKALDRERREFEGEDQPFGEDGPTPEQVALLEPKAAESRLDAVLKANEAERARGPFRDELPVRTEYGNESPRSSTAEQARRNGEMAVQIRPGAPQDIWAKLREPFDPSDIDMLPKGGKELAYVGHAGVTDRLLAVDPYWNWEPVAFDEQGMPRFVVNEAGDPMGLWIRLTIGGVTRLGYGSCDPNKSEAEKELIGDAIRNAAMRFGVALDLWRKSWVAEHLANVQKGDHERRGRQQQPPPPPAQPLPAWTEELWTRLGDAGLKRGDLEPVIQRDLKDPNIRFTQQNFYPLVETWLGAAETHTLPVLISRAADVKNA